MKHLSQIGFLSLAVILIAGSSAAIAQIQVTAANPNNAAQGTINLNVAVNGNGFKKGAKAQWFISGTTNPGGVTVNSTAFNNSGQLTANITVAADAVISGYDILVVNSDGRTGKGTELFAVNSNGNSSKGACSTPVVISPPVNACASSIDQASCLDSTFGNGGLVETSTGMDDSAYEIRQQTDGKLVAIGQFGLSSASNGVVVQRYNTDGSLDTTFGASGIARYRFSGTNYTQVRAGVLDGAGNVLVAGFTNLTSFVVRFTSTGGLDSSFGSGGVFLFSGYGQAFGIALQPDGKIVVVTKGSIRTTSAGWVLRIASSGTLDTSFGSKGIVQHSGSFFTNVTVQPLTGNTFILVTTSAFSILRFTSSGSIDSTFGTSGEATNGLCGSGGEAWEIALDPVAGIYAAGYAKLTNNGSPKIFLAKYTNNGQLDPTFGDAANTGQGSSGATLIDFYGGANYSAGLAASRDSMGNAVLMLGVQASGYLNVARVKANGALDTTWAGVGGSSTTFDGSTWSATSLAIGVQVDGRIVEAGSNQGPIGNPPPINFVLARYWP